MQTLKEKIEHYECTHKDCSPLPTIEKTYENSKAFFCHSFRKHGLRKTECKIKITSNPAKPIQPQYLNGRMVKKGVRPPKSTESTETRIKRHYKKREYNRKIPSTQPNKCILQFPVTFEIECDIYNVRIGEQQLSPQTIRIGTKGKGR